ncbi:MAG TPA: hypothetical protein VME41_02135 [Stellaceae bacterium]|nr:hypothetical protein [Stellaceae bacterium]
MTYRVFYGDTLAMAGGDLHQQDGVCAERFSTEHEALCRARELLDEDARTIVTVCDAEGRQLSGVCLHLRLGYACE